jgi:LPS-assembly lipoprotein
MSSYNRRFVLGLPLAVMACGFAPAYGPNGSANGLRGAIRVADGMDKLGFDLANRLKERLGAAQTDRFDLTYVIATSAVGIGITPDNAITRYNLNGSVDWTLTDRATATRVTGGRVENFTSWSATGSTVAGLAAEEDARLRLMRILADDIVARLLATSGDWLK